MDSLNIYVAGVPMVSIPIKSDKQREVFDSVSSGAVSGDVFIAKMNETIPAIKLGKAA